MPEYLTPGVYVEEVSFRAPSIEGVGTSTAGFAGVTLTGPTGSTPELLTSFGDFQNVYGGYDKLSISSNSSDAKNNNYLAMSVKAFFDNGGSRLYVSRVFANKSSSDTGLATGGTVSDSDVAVSARFPGASANQVVSLRLKAARTQNVSSLPPGSLLALVGQNTSSLVQGIAAGDTQLTISSPFPANPAFLLIDSEILSVTGIDSTGTRLTVTRGQRSTAAAAHNKGVAVLAPAGVLLSAAAATDTQLTIGSAPSLTTTPAPTTTAAVTTTAAATTTTPAPTTTPGATTTSGPAPASALAGGAAALLMVDSEIVAVTGVDAGGTRFTVTRGASGTTAAAHSINTPVFAPIVYYTNGVTGTFSGGGMNLASPAPAGLYVLTMQVTASGAAGSASVFDGLGFDPAHPYYLGTVLAPVPPRHIDALQNQIAFTIGKTLVPATLFSTLFGNWGGPTANATKTYSLTGGNDGGEPGAPDFDAALARFTALEDIAIVAAPGSGIFNASQDIVNSLITHVSQQRAYRIAVLETPPNQIASDNVNVRSRIDSSYAALYAPWVYTPNPLARPGTAIAAEIPVPPTGFICGIYARNDEQHGVAKAPANEVLLGASRLERNITFGEQGLLNPLGVNCLRYFPNRGYRVWGARTATSNPEFMYVNVRRYLIYLEHSVDHSTQWAVFENNGPALWSRVKDAVGSFLYNEFKEGNLLGDTPAQAFFVRCDRTTMTQNDLDNGRMICLVGVAVLKPAEFVIFRIGQKTAEAQR